MDVEAGEEMIERIKPLVRKTFTPGVLTDIGAFGAFFKVDWKSYKDPVMVSSVDGVGTKLKVAFMMDQHGTVGQDLVNHCVNDIAVCGAKPLFFLDYFSTGKLDTDVAVQVIEGFSKACIENQCALIGGETAEMPDIYAAGEYDLAGTIVGVVDKNDIIDGSTIEKGDVLIGFPSSGLHTNGYSLARHALFPTFSPNDCPEELEGASVGATLLAVHKSYLHLIESLRSLASIHGLIHVTGGGIPGNTKRVIPKGLSFDVDYASWQRPAIYKLIQKVGSVPEDDMRKAFNLGIGLIAVIRESDVKRILIELSAEMPVEIGTITEA